MNGLRASEEDLKRKLHEAVEEAEAGRVSEQRMREALKATVEELAVFHASKGRLQKNHDEAEQGYDEHTLRTNEALTNAM